MARKKITGSAGEHQQALLNEFIKGSPLHITDMMRVLDNCCKATACNTLNALKDLGYQFDVQIVKKKAYYTLVQNKDFSMDYELLTPANFKEYLILYALQSAEYATTHFPTNAKYTDYLKSALNILPSEPKQRDISSTEIGPELDRKGTTEAEEKNTKCHKYLHIKSCLTELSIKQTQFYKLLKSLQDNNIISRNSITEPYTILYPLKQMRVYKKHALNAECDALSALNSSAPHFHILNRIYIKQCIALGRDNFWKNYDYLTVYGKNYQQSEKISTQLQNLAILECSTHYLEVQYNSSHFLFAVGLIYYTEEKDQLYLIGKVKNIGSKKAGHDITLKYNNIKKLSSSDETHDYFESPYYHKILNYVFSSIDSIPEKPDSVEVHFTKTPELEEALNNLCLLRNQTAKLEITNDCFIYTDTISDLGNFSKFLRKYGSQAKIIQPQALINNMSRTISKYKERYEETENEIIHESI